jgi:hypothetical protein
MGRDGLMWGMDDDTMTLEEYRRVRDMDNEEVKKSDFVEVTTENLREEWND